MFIKNEIERLAHVLCTGKFRSQVIRTRNVYEDNQLKCRILKKKMSFLSNISASRNQSEKYIYAVHK